MITKILGAAILASSLITGCTEIDYLTSKEIKANAEANLSAYAKNLGEGYKVVGCSDADSDSNNYVSCQVQKLKDEQLLDYECAYIAGRTGCRKSAVKIDQQENETENYR